VSVLSASLLALPLATESAWISDDDEGACIGRSVVYTDHVTILLLNIEIYCLQQLDSCSGHYIQGQGVVDSRDEETSSVLQISDT
jgi:hypothetical protein